MKNSLIDKYEIAIEAFKSGSNCAQSVLKGFVKELNIEEIQAMQMASGFGAGMGRLQKTCGAVTGAFMVIGLSNSLAIQLDEVRRDKTNHMIQLFEKRFIGAHSNSDCQHLINSDLNTEEGQIKFKEQQLSELVCQKCIFSSIRILEEVLYKN